MARDVMKKVETILFESFVGSDTYGVWVKMLTALVPHGRTHRLAVMVAGMVQYAADMVYEKDPELYEELFNLTDYDDLENKKLVPYIEKLFKDAKVKSNRVNSRGQGYSIVESALMEYEHWDYMPWE